MLEGEIHDPSLEMTGEETRSGDLDSAVSVCGFWVKGSGDDGRGSRRGR